ncbi:MAG: 1-acyl-sn-glycerol-3-phosphate acyltransferase [Bacteroidales bacterium]|nr:1-acyl-sn-glycerol-3-phosphate acyltransferase [Bacteroidales bacterium]
MSKKFEHIRAYEDSDVDTILQQLADDNDLRQSISFLPEDFSKIFSQLQEIKTIRDFQQRIIYPFANWIVQKTVEELTYSGIENLHADVPYLFISNHRDIVMDPMLINYVLYRSHFPTTQIGIGNNLLIKPWIEKIVRLNKSFVVYRNLKGKRLFFELKQLSEYIKYTLIEKKESVWIAQREGRAKNGIDETQLSLLKMLNLSFRNNKGYYHIVPVTFSYEFDPCDALKAVELSKACEGLSMNKNPEDDLLHMKLGLLENKGNVHVHFDKPLYIELPIENQFLKKIKLALDENIQKNQRCFSTHLYAYWKIFDPNYPLRSNDFERARQYFEQQKNKYKLTESMERFLLLPYAHSARNCFSKNSSFNKLEDNQRK